MDQRVAVRQVVRRVHHDVIAPEHVVETHGAVDSEVVWLAGKSAGAPGHHVHREIAPRQSVTMAGAGAEAAEELRRSTHVGDVEGRELRWGERQRREGGPTAGEWRG